MNINQLLVLWFRKARAQDDKEPTDDNLIKSYDNNYLQYYMLLYWRDLEKKNTGGKYKYRV